jgi:hypothetical protein
VHLAWSECRYGHRLGLDKRVEEIIPSRNAIPGRKSLQLDPVQIVDDLRSLK